MSKVDSYQYKNKSGYYHNLKNQLGVYLGQTVVELTVAPCYCKGKNNYCHSFET